MKVVKTSRVCTIISIESRHHLMSSPQRKKISILMITMFIAITSFGITGPVIPAYLESINQGGMASGMIIAIFAGAQLLFAPLGGKWTDQFGRRKMIIIGLM